MELYLQFGYGMKQLVIDLSKKWGGAKVILSPRDATPEQLENWYPEFKKNNVECLFDPQCYYPKTNHPRLKCYSYWNNSMCTQLESNNSPEESLIEKINYYNDLVESKDFIIPSILLDFDSNWFNRWESHSLKLIEASAKIVKHKQKLLTLSLPSGLLTQTEDKIEKVLKIVEKWEVDGYYIIAQPYEGQYLVKSPLWLSNLLLLTAGLKLQNKKVIVGYGNHQSLSLSTAKVDAIASGTFLNVRRFTNKFEDNEGIMRKSKWYYYPNSLSEYKFEFLDSAFNSNVLQSMKPKSEFDSSFVDKIFSGMMPSTVKIKETELFKHYLTSLKKQSELCTQPSYDETLAANEVLYKTAEKRIEQLKSKGIYAQTRSFEDIVDVNRSAIQRLDEVRGFSLKHSWSEI
ncbi:MAG: hypothetical protein CVU99_03330 [Firmicutes bacterium HGW-Firmicutes-4]|jgi:hypothetical protein|nr:MAG: hypothetical protein CVV25_14355 [Ignavibacteriae bacterium HGW-Ignavibacteriae-4]PKM61392.1 MAG: hypothetical protein CVU99_03330 [Firmicutes bacterium HGW-Firmicutes-4]